MIAAPEVTLNPYDPEAVISYELGTKGALASGGEVSIGLDFNWQDYSYGNLANEFFSLIQNVVFVNLRVGKFITFRVGIVQAYFVCLALFGKQIVQMSTQPLLISRMGIIGDLHGTDGNRGFVNN